MGKRQNIPMRFLCIVLLLTLCGGCASRPQDMAPPSRTDASLGRERVIGVWILRYKVRLEIPRHGFAQSFDGLMRLDAANRSIRVTALGGLGMQLFDMEIGADWMRVVYLHPAMKKIPCITEQIASCIQRIWFDSFGLLVHTIDISDDDWEILVIEKMLGEPWVFRIQFVDSRAGYTVAVRLLQTQREDIP